MPEPFFLPLEACEDPALVGGKAAGLGRLLRQGFPVPPGFCLTTVVYRQALKELGIDPEAQWEQARVASDSSRDDLLKECRRRIETFSTAQTMLWISELKLSQVERTRDTDNDTLWAVRSSASDEDTITASFAGVYHTRLGVSRSRMASAIIECWASIWTPASLAYHTRSASQRTIPCMAVVLQPLLSPLAAGVAYSRHPVAGRSDVVAINSVVGLAEPLVGGRVTPDSFIVERGLGSRQPTISERRVAEKTVRRVADRTGLIDQPVPLEDRRAPSLKDRDILDVAGLAVKVEGVFGMPVDIEWAIDGRRIWLLQARPIPPTRSLEGSPLSVASCVWSRANFKETLPDLPSPLGLSFLEAFMEANIVRHYRELGCRMPPGLPSARIIRGRPYINVTLLQSFTYQLSGNPALVLEQMGGQSNPVPASPPRLAWWKLLRAVLLMEIKIRRAAKHAPAWFADMKRLGQTHAEMPIATMAPEDLLARMEGLGKRLQERDVTFALAGGVSQGFQVLNWLLGRRVGPSGKSLLNTALQGLGTVISAKQILWLAELAEQAGREPVARDFLMADPWDPAPFRARLAGTRFLLGLEKYLREYGHRAIGESDPMSPRFAEGPDYLLGVVRGHLLAPRPHAASVIRHEQESAREDALRRIRAALGRRWHERALFAWWYRRLRLFLALREANRHHMMYFSGAVRRVARAIGTRLAGISVLESGEDVFYLTIDELGVILGDTAQDWKNRIAVRKAERVQNAAHHGPDTVIGLENSPPGGIKAQGPEALRGIPVSAGYAEGPVRLVVSPDHARLVKRGDILVMTVIDPGMAPALGLASGLIVEMGGTLSHGAIIAREYGIPAVVNAHGIMQVLKDGERVGVDARSGEIRRLGA
ncbi:MAG: PEP/pyruvate-binding domain-containing protein [Nitrospiraceae bacterium]